MFCTDRHKTPFDVKCFFCVQRFICAKKTQHIKIKLFKNYESKRNENALYSTLSLKSYVRLKWFCSISSQSVRLNWVYDLSGKSYLFRKLGFAFRIDRFSNVSCYFERKKFQISWKCTTYVGVRLKW